MKGFIICLKTCLAVDKTLITSVLGFDLKAEIVDHNGELIRSGVKSTYVYAVTDVEPEPRILDKNFFTHYNESLLSKIREYRRLND
jgi:hypothetical protein